MSDLIDRKAFKEKYCVCGWMEEISEEEFDAFPTVDAEPVKHGHFVEQSYVIGIKQYKCSNCELDKDFWRMRFLQGDEHYCPNCGAKFDL